MDAEDRLQTETSSGNALKLSIALSDRGAGHFYAPLGVSQTFVSLVPPPHILLTSILSLRCLLQWSPMPTPQDGIRTSQGDALVTLGLPEFSSAQLRQLYILIRQPGNSRPQLQQPLKTGVGIIMTEV